MKKLRKLFLFTSLFTLLFSASALAKTDKVKDQLLIKACGESDYALRETAKDIMWLESGPVSIELRIQGSEATVEFASFHNAQVLHFSFPGIIYTSKGQRITVTKIGKNAFASQQMAEMIIPDSVKVIEKGAFYRCALLTSVSTGAGVKKIGNEAFYGCKNLQAADLGTSTEQIGKKAFYDCGSLNFVVIRAKNLKKVGASAFKRAAKDLRFDYPIKKGNKYAKLLKGKADKTATIPSNKKKKKTKDPDFDIVYENGEIVIYENGKPIGRKVNVSEVTTDFDF